MSLFEGFNPIIKLFKSIDFLTSIDGGIEPFK